MAINLELPLLIVDVQRGGPSTGLPTKTEQADLLHAMYGRHGEAPLPIVAPRTPSDCFQTAIEATRLAVKYRTPVILLSDGYLANGAEPWRLPDLAALARHRPGVRDRAEPRRSRTGRRRSGRICVTRRRSPAPGRPRGCPASSTVSADSRRQTATGNVAYDPVNHEKMVHLRRDKIAGIAKDIPDVEVDDEGGSELLVLGWGSTFGAIAAGVQRVRARGLAAAHAHLMHLNPFPANLGGCSPATPRSSSPR